MFATVMLLPRRLRCSRFDNSESTLMEDNEVISLYSKVRLRMVAVGAVVMEEIWLKDAFNRESEGN